MRRLALLTACLLFSWHGGAAGSEATFDLAEHEGKVVIVDFWASWCVPCRRSFPWLNAMHDAHADKGLVIIGVNLDEERAAAEEFLREFPPSFRIFYDTSKDLARKFDVIAMPSSFLIGRDGEIRKRHYGFKVRKQEEYETAIVEALSLLE
ncbi:MAG: TlpA family protein disulfide reductase [Gammaproteobacteria bacterium]|nr:TlpA family protein disulfide reductase [Gammaproteobacteria bacterium]MDH3435144.1 TlpA family protein disulfide reductase [Gammaproteobacteria bacterium]